MELLRPNKLAPEVNAPDKVRDFVFLGSGVPPKSDFVFDLPSFSFDFLDVSDATS